LKHWKAGAGQKTVRLHGSACRMPRKKNTCSLSSSFPLLHDTCTSHLPKLRTTIRCTRSRSRIECSAAGMAGVGRVKAVEDVYSNWLARFKRLKSASGTYVVHPYWYALKVRTRTRRAPPGTKIKTRLCVTWRLMERGPPPPTAWRTANVSQLTECLAMQWDDD
jgi:hypothetical protein